MNTLIPHDADDFTLERPADSSADAPESFEINVTTRDFLDDLGNISMGLQMTIMGDPTADRLRDALSKTLTVQECCRGRKLPAIAYISAHDIIALDQIVDYFRALALETDLDIGQLTKRAEILIRSFDLLLQELNAEYV